MTEELRAELETLMLAIEAMRVHQRAYFKGDRSTERLLASKAAEKRVDEIVRTIRDGQRTAAQPSLFGGGR